MFKNTVIAAALILLSLQTIANTGDKEKTIKLKTTRVSGIVLDNQNEPLSGVKVYVAGTQQFVYTDFDGNFIMTNIVEGQSVKFSYVSFEDYELNNPFDKNNEVEIILKSN